MLPKEVFELFKEWMAKIEIGVGQKDGNTLCEATRMALAFALILHAYFPDMLTREIGKQMKDSFTRALACVTEQRKNGIDPDGCYDLYECNIRERLQKYEELSQTWWSAAKIA